jgi:hypothetical protein
MTRSQVREGVITAIMYASFFPLLKEKTLWGVKFNTQFNNSAAY